MRRIEDQRDQVFGNRQTRPAGDRGAVIGDEDEQRWDAASLSFRPAIRGSAEALGHTVHHINRNDNCIIGSMIGFHSILTYIFMYKGLKFAALFFTVALLPEAVVPALI